MVKELENVDVDITPTDVGGPGKNKRRFIPQNTEVAQIKENPSGLTKEGVQKKIELWQESQNRYVLSKYYTMLKTCKVLEKSGKTKDGLVIYSRNPDGSARWTESPKRRV